MEKYQITILLLCLTLITYRYTYFKKYWEKKYPPGKGKYIISRNATRLTAGQVIYYELRSCNIPYTFARVIFEGCGFGEEDAYIYTLEYYDSETAKRIDEESKKTKAHHD